MISNESMTGRDNIQSLLVLRKLTRAIEDTLRARLASHLTTLTPLWRPETVLGARVQGAKKASIPKPEQAFKELETLYEKVARTAPYNLRTDLNPPFDLTGMSLDITPVEYTHVAQSGSSSRDITIRCPLTWTLSYKGFETPRLRELLQSKMRAPVDLQRFIVAHLAMHLVTTFRPGLVHLLDDLRFPATSTNFSEFGGLPVTVVRAVISTERPSDEVIIESAELTGMDAFEEVVSMETIRQLEDPLRAQLLDLAAEHAPELTTEAKDSSDGPDASSGTAVSSASRAKNTRRTPPSSSSDTSD